MSGSTWCSDTNRKAARPWRPTTVEHIEQWASRHDSPRDLSKLKTNSLLSGCSAVFHPLTYEGGMDCDRYLQWSPSWFPFLLNFLTQFDFPNQPLTPKHQGSRWANRHVDTDPGVWPDAQTAVQQPSPSEDHAALSNQPQPQHQLEHRRTVSR